MPSIRRPLVCALAALTSFALLTAEAGAAPNNMVALGTGANGNTLVGFSGDAPGTATSVPVTGLGSSTLVGIDYRPATGGLYGLGVEGATVSLFTIDRGTGAATLVGSTTLATTLGTSFGVGFNPVADRLRVVDDLGNNFRLHPDTGATIVPPDTTLNFTGLPGGSANAPEAAVAYDRDVVGAGATTLYGIVAGGDRLVTQGGVNSMPSANGGVLFDVGPLGVDVTGNTGFDIDPTTGEAYMAAESGGLTSLFRVDLATGAATSVGQIGNGSVGLSSLTIGGPAFSPPPPPPPAEAKLEALSVSPKRFAAVGSKAGATGSAVAPPRGTTVSYVLSADATVAFRVERRQPGRLVGGKCRPLTKGNRDKKPCPLWVGASSRYSTFSDAGKAGSNSFFFSGRLRRRLTPNTPRPLAPGSYRVLAKLGATSLAANFRIVPAIPGRPRNAGR